MSESIDDDTTIMFGKYLGLTYKELLHKDINYCLWLDSLRFTNNTNKNIIAYLKSGKLAERLLEIKLDKLKNA